MHTLYSRIIWENITKVVSITGGWRMLLSMAVPLWEFDGSVFTYCTCIAYCVNKGHVSLKKLVNRVNMDLFTTSLAASNFNLVFCVCGTCIHYIPVPQMTIH